MLTELVLISQVLIPNFPTGSYLLKVNNRNTRKRYETCSKSTVKTPERRLSSFLRCAECFQGQQLRQLIYDCTQS